MTKTKPCQRQGHDGELNDIDDDILSSSTESVNYKSFASQYLKVSRRSDPEWSVCCPVHDDAHASASYNIETGLFNCHGCGHKANTYQLQEHFGIKAEKTSSKRETARYDYQDENGKILFQQVRYELPNGEKTFSSYNPNTREWTIKGVKRVPYHLPRLLDGIREGKTVFITEGEKDVHTLEKLGCIATTNPGGAGKWREEYSAYIPQGHRVIIAPDADEPGQDHAKQLKDSLPGRNVSVLDFGYTIVEKHGRDVSDWIAEGHTQEEFDRLIADAKQEEDSEYNRFKAAFKTLSDFDNVDPVEMLVENNLIRHKLHILSSETGTGKSIYTLALCYAIASGEPLFGKYPVSHQGKVIYVDEENSEDIIKERIAGLCARKDVPIMFLHMQQVKLDKGPFLDLLEKLVDEIHPELIVFDSLICFHNKDENSNSEMRDIMRDCGKRLCNKGPAVLFQHHLGKNTGTSRGAGDIVSAVDLELKLTKDSSGYIYLGTGKSRCRKITPFKMSIESFDDNIPRLNFLGEGAQKEKKGKTSDSEIKGFILNMLDSGAEYTFEEVRKKIADEGTVCGKDRLRELLDKMFSSKKISIRKGERNTQYFSLVS